MGFHARAIIDNNWGQPHYWAPQAQASYAYICWTESKYLRLKRRPLISCRATRGMMISGLWKWQFFLSMILICYYISIEVNPLLFSYLRRKTTYAHMENTLIRYWPSKEWRQGQELTRLKDENPVSSSFTFEYLLITELIENRSICHDKSWRWRRSTENDELRQRLRHHLSDQIEDADKKQ